MWPWAVFMYVSCSGYSKITLYFQNQFLMRWFQQTQCTTFHHFPFSLIKKRHLSFATAYALVVQIFMSLHRQASQASCQSHTKKMSCLFSPAKILMVQFHFSPRYSDTPALDIFSLANLFKMCFTRNNRFMLKYPFICILQQHCHLLLVLKKCRVFLWKKLNFGRKQHSKERSPFYPHARAFLP